MGECRTGVQTAYTVLCDPTLSEQSESKGRAQRGAAYFSENFPSLFFCWRIFYYLKF